MDTGSWPTWNWSGADAAVATGAAPTAQEPELRHWAPGHFDVDWPDEEEDEAAHEQNRAGAEPTEPASQPQPSRHYGPRTCRICLEVVYPTYHYPLENVPSFLQREARVTWESEDPASGRLLRPCKCRGSARYVHEGCLNEWRRANTTNGNRNYWTCPTCGFKYRLERMSWGRWINNTVTQIAMTLVILLVAIFILGFVADPIINLYLDPYDTVTSGVERITLDEDGEGSWFEHLVKGMASLGLLGFLNVVFTLSPFQWWNVRNSGIMNAGRAGRQAAGRDRLASMSWVVLVVGIGTFVWAVFKGVRAWSRRTLELAAQRVMDVPLDGDDDDEEGDGNVEHEPDGAEEPGT